MEDPFARLGLERSWRLTAQDIRAAQRRCSIAAHPDRRLDAQERRAALEESSRINAAAGELLDPLSRGSAILEALAPSPRPAEPRLDPAFLIELMELREAVDAAGTDAELRGRLAAQTNRDLDAAEAETDLAMASLISRPGEREWLRAFDALNRLRALRRAHDGLGR